MKAMICACSLLLLLVANAAPGFAQMWLDNSFSVDVEVTTTWTDSGIEVTAGDTLFIRAHGSVSDGASGWDGLFGPEGIIRGQAGGCVSCPLVGFPQGALIARIGEGAPFYVGSFSSFSCESSGVLYLGVNDDSPAGYVGTLRAFIWGGAAVPPPPVIDCDEGACSEYTTLGSVRGDVGADTVSYESNGARWFRIRIVESDGSMVCNGLSATFVLVPPSGANYDLYVYWDDCWLLYGSSTNTGSASEFVQIGWPEDCNMGFPTGTDDSRYVRVKVVCSSVSIDDHWFLYVYGNNP